MQTAKEVREAASLIPKDRPLTVEEQLILRRAAGLDITEMNSEAVKYRTALLEISNLSKQPYNYTQRMGTIARTALA